MNDKIVKALSIVLILTVSILVLSNFVPDIVTVILVMLLSMGSALYLIIFGKKNGRTIALLLMIFASLFLINSVNKKANDLKYLQVKTVTELNKVIGHSLKPVMVDFWASWCVSCNEFDNNTFKNPEVKKVLSNYLLVKVDVTNNSEDDKKLMKKFGLFGPPALIFFKDGKEEKNKRIVGFKTPEQFLKVVK